MPLLSVTFPSNLLAFIGGIAEILHFDFITHYEFYEKYYQLGRDEF